MTSLHLSGQRMRQAGTVGGMLALAIVGMTLPSLWTVQAQTPPQGQPLTVRSDIQEANSETGVVTARGNVQFFYPARQIQGTAAQAQYYSRERRLVLSGNVYVLQEGNSMRAETMTYLIDDGRFIATPQNSQQVESIYLVTQNESKSASPSASPKPAPSEPSFSLPTAPPLIP